MTHVRIPESLDDFKDLVINLAHDAHLMFPTGEPTDKFIWALSCINKFKLSELQVQQLIAIFPDLKTESNCRIRFAQHVWRTFYKEDINISDLLEPVEDDVAKEVDEQLHVELEEIVIHDVPDQPIEGLEVLTKEIILESIPESADVNEVDEDGLEDVEDIDETQPSVEEATQTVKKRVSKKSSDAPKTTKRRSKGIMSEVV